MAMLRLRLCLVLVRAQLEPVVERPVCGWMPQCFEPSVLTLAEREGLLRVSHECDVFLFGEGLHGVRVRVRVRVSTPSLSFFFFGLKLSPWPG